MTFARDLVRQILSLQICRIVEWSNSELYQVEVDVSMVNTVKDY